MFFSSKKAALGTKEKGQRPWSEHEVRIDPVYILMHIPGGIVHDPSVHIVA